MAKISLDNGNSFFAIAEALPEIEKRGLWPDVLASMDQGVCWELTMNNPEYMMGFPYDNLPGYLRDYLTALDNDFSGALIVHPEKPCPESFSSLDEQLYFWTKEQVARRLSAQEV